MEKRAPHFYKKNLQINCCFQFLYNVNEFVNVFMFTNLLLRKLSVLN
jgi:hypothetical protein